MDATATPRGISLAVGELGARGRPINKQCTAVRISSTVNGDMCGTCQAGLPFALFVGRPLNRGLADVVLLVPFLYASVQTLAPCTAHSSLHGTSGEIAER